MALINTLTSWLMRHRLPRINYVLKHPHETQQQWFEKLIRQAKDTEWGKSHSYHTLRTQADFQHQVPLNDYEDIKPYINRLLRGENNLLWPGKIEWFAKSSGTTADKSKFIPVSKEAIKECHFKAGKDLLTFYCTNYPGTQLFAGKVLGMSGSHNKNRQSIGPFTGDISAVLLENLPSWIAHRRTPAKENALLDNWEKKIDTISHIVAKQNVTNITGVPSWTLLLLKHILEITGKKNISEVWPNLELFIHGGVNFEPYREQFEKIVPPAMNYLEAYNASEGFFAFQDQKNTGEMLMLLDHGIYYEFIPVDELGSQNPKVLQLHEVQLKDVYALVISTNAGLWRYMIGDTIRFTSLTPHRIVITGRTQNFINAVGEELMIDNAEKAMSAACEKTGAVLTEYTAAPVYFNDNENAAHEWLVEFESAPENYDLFAEILDNELKTLNSDYEAKRYHDMILRKPLIRAVPRGTFYKWMKKKGKLGGQHKVPRLANDRKHINEILNLLNSNH